MKRLLLTIFLLLPLFGMAAVDHLVLSEVVLTPNSGEYIQISNQTGTAIDLSNYYITDATDTVNGKFYYNLPGGTNYHSGASDDFTARFPAGYTLEAGATVTIAIDSTRYRDYYGTAADIAIKNNFRYAVDGISSIGGAPYFLNDIQESLILFYWDGSSATIQDVDYFVWGSRLNCVDKSGVSGYNADTPVAQQEFLAAHVVDEKFQRTSDEGSENSSGGNGITGHDETSEPLSQTWQTVAIANTKPQISQPTYSPQSPTTEDQITFYCNVTDDSAVDSVVLYYKTGTEWLHIEMTLNGGTYQATVGPFTSEVTISYYIHAVDDTDLKNNSNVYQLAIVEPQPTLTIQYIRDNWDTYNGQTVTLRGVVTIGSNIIITGRTSAYFQDQSGKGLNLYNSTPTDLIQGDSIEVTGSLTEYNGVYELTDWTSSIEVLAQDVPITSVNELDIIELINDLADWEGSYVEISGTVADRSDPTATNTGCNIIIEDETGRTTVRIWNTTGVIYDALGILVNEETDSLLSLGNKVTLRGVVGIYSEAPQILLGYASDVEPYVEGEAGVGKTKLSVAPYPFVPKLGEVIQYSYEYPENCRVILRVYDMSGRFITTLEDSYYAVTWKKEKTWNGRNELDQLLPPGNYIFHLQTTNRSTGKTETDIAPVVIGVKF